MSFDHSNTARKDRSDTAKDRLTAQPASNVSAPANGSKRQPVSNWAWMHHSGSYDWMDTYGSVTSTEWSD
jgi:hypothetical protein